MEAQRAQLPSLPGLCQWQWRVVPRMAVCYALRGGRPAPWSPDPHGTADRSKRPTLVAVSWAASVQGVGALNVKEGIVSEW